jgi:membrane protein
MSRRRNLHKYRVRELLRQASQFFRKILSSPFLSALYGKFERDNALFLARGLAFDVLVCLIPAVFLLFVLFGFLFDSPQETIQYMSTYLKSIIPFSTRQVLRNLFSVVKTKKVIGLVGGIGLIWTLSRLFGSIRTVLDRIVEMQEGRGFLAGKVFDFKMMFLSSLFFVFTVMITSLASFLKAINPDLLGVKVIYLGVRGELISLCLAFFFTVCMFFFLYRFVPYQRIRTKNAIWAALAASILWEMAKQGFRFYLFPGFGIPKVYGSFGMLFTLVFWVYYSCIVFILGAEMAWVWEKRGGKNLRS